MIAEKIEGERFLDICNLVKNIKDYDLEENK